MVTGRTLISEITFRKLALKVNLLSEIRGLFSHNLHVSFQNLHVSFRVSIC